MRTSNKILLAALSAVLLIPTFIHFALFAKLKRGEFADEATGSGSRYTHHSLKPKSYVSARGLGNLRIIHSDTLALHVEHWDTDDVQFSEIGDSLLINTGTAAREEGNSRSSQQVILYLPSAQGIVMDDCFASVDGSAQEQNAPSMSFVVKDSHLNIGSSNRPGAKPGFYNQLQVRSSNQSVITLYHNAFIADLQLNLAGNTRLVDEGVNLGTASGIFGDSTQIHLMGRNMARFSLEKP